MVSNPSRKNVSQLPPKPPGEGSKDTKKRRRRRQIAEEKAREAAEKGITVAHKIPKSLRKKGRHLPPKPPGEGSKKTLGRRHRRHVAEENAATTARKAAMKSGDVSSDDTNPVDTDVELSTSRAEQTQSPHLSQLPCLEANHTYTSILSALANREQRSLEPREEHHQSESMGVKQEPRESNQVLDTATLKETGAQDAQSRVEQQMGTQGTTVAPEVRIEPHENALMPDDVPEIKQDPEEDVSAFERHYPFLFQNLEETVEIKIEG